MNDSDPGQAWPRITAEVRWPDDLDPDTTCFTVDVEWAAPEVLADVVQLFDAHSVAAMLFITHDGVAVPGHERGLHPNFRWNGDAHRRWRERDGDPFAQPEERLHGAILETFLSYAPAPSSGTRATRAGPPSS